MRKGWSVDSLRLWLPSLHTKSQNQTRGAHWAKSYKARRGEAGALAAAIRAVAARKVAGVWWMQLEEAVRVLALISAGVDVRKIRKPSFTCPEDAPRLVITYTRVSTKPLDAENWTGSTKGMTDCLRYALPGLMKDDAPEFVEIRHLQVRCAKRCEEGTWVELSRGSI